MRNYNQLLADMRGGNYGAFRELLKIKSELGLEKNIEALRYCIHQIYKKMFPEMIKISEIENENETEVKQ